MTPETLLTEFSPHDFEVILRDPTFVAPCWLALDPVLRPISPKARKATLYNLALSLRLDVFGREPLSHQLLEEWDRYYLLAGDQWRPALDEHYPSLRDTVEQSPRYLPTYGKTIQIPEFQKVSLGEILAEPSSSMEFYATIDLGAYQKPDVFLRIHTRVDGEIPPDRYLWWEKSFPYGLHPEDVVPWFQNLVKRLPAKQRPKVTTQWIERLCLRCEGYRPPALGDAVEWNLRPKIVLVFGPTHDVGHAPLFHLERSRIRSITREGYMLRIRAEIESTYAPDEQEWFFAVVTRNSMAAAQAENAMVRGNAIHFGVDHQIEGIAARNGDKIHAIGLPEHEVRALLGVSGSLELLSHPRFRYKLYQEVRQNADITGDDTAG